MSVHAQKYLLLLKYEARHLLNGRCLAFLLVKIGGGT